MQVLTHLVMRQNDIGSQAAAFFLSTQAWLKKIDLAATGINQPGIVILCQLWTSCAANATVTDLSIASNSIGDRAANQLCAALLANRQLQCVDLSACQLGNQSGRRMLSLAQSLLHSRAAGRHHSLQVRQCLSRRLQWLHSQNPPLQHYILVTKTGYQARMSAPCGPTYTVRPNLLRSERMAHGVGSLISGVHLVVTAVNVAVLMLASLNPMARCMCSCRRSYWQGTIVWTLSWHQVSCPRLTSLRLGAQPLQVLLIW
jgi:hypothetical protein